jgi:hypothetical protein
MKCKVLTLTVLHTKEYHVPLKKTLNKYSKTWKDRLLPKSYFVKIIDDDDNIVSDEHLMPPPNHEDSLQCVSQ